MFILNMNYILKEMSANKSEISWATISRYVLFIIKLSN